MNLSDLVHRTAGDNKVLPPTAISNDSSRLPNSNNNNSLFQHAMIDPSTSPSNLFNNFSRQDQQLLFSMPNADWMNSNMFFNNSIMNASDGLMDSIQSLPSTSQPNLSVKQDFSQTISSPPRVYQDTNNLSQTLLREFNITMSHSLSKSPLSLSTTLNDNIIPEDDKLVQSTIDSPIQSSTLVTQSSPLPNSISPPSENTNPRITGSNVTAETIEEGYIQFVLDHDPSFIQEGIDSLVYAKRKFQSVPKTGDISYTTWDIYQLVSKLYKKEIKNWSQLVGQLGLADMSGRPQFAQRVKRWMHRYKIDCYFDYLLGQDYEFNGEKYANCLLIGNYKKRLKLSQKNGDLLKYDSQDEDEEEELLEDDIEGSEHRIPIVFAGSRKRMRDTSQNSIQMIENAQRYLQTKYEESDVDQNESEAESQNEEIQSMQDEDRIQASDQDMNEEDELPEEEDELASSSSSPVSTRMIIPSPPHTAFHYSPATHSPISLLPTASSNLPPKSPIPSSPSSHTSPSSSNTPLQTRHVSLLPSLPPLSSCSNCSQQESKQTELEKEITHLKSYITQLEAKIEKQNSQVTKLIQLRDRTERWRKQIISDLARGPAIASDDDEDDEDDDDTTTTSEES